MKPQNMQSIGKWISVLHRQAQVYISRELKPYGISASEYIYLVHLGAHTEEINQKQLSDLIQIDSALTTRCMKSLEKKGYISRQKRHSDQRCYTIKLTQKGKDIQPVILQTLENWTNIISRGVLDAEKDALVEKLMIMSKNALHETKGD